MASKIIGVQQDYQRTAQCNTVLHLQMLYALMQLATMWMHGKQDQPRSSALLPDSAFFGV